MKGKQRAELNNHCAGKRVKTEWIFSLQIIIVTLKKTLCHVDKKAKLLKCHHCLEHQSYFTPNANASCHQGPVL